MMPVPPGRLRGNGRTSLTRRYGRSVEAVDSRTEIRDFLTRTLGGTSATKRALSWGGFDSGVISARRGKLRS